MITKLTLTQFRNHKQCRLAADTSLVCLVGPNGSGKTNILEAISYLSPGRGMRRAALNDVATLGGDGTWAVASHILSNGDDCRIGTGLSATALRRQTPSREMRIDGDKAQSQADILQYMRLLWLVPAMDGLFTGPSADRRRFLDRWITTVEPSHATALSNYEKAMRQRKKALEFGASGVIMLDSLEEQMALHAAAIGLARHTHVIRLMEGLSRSMDQNSAFPWSQIALQGTIEADIMDGVALSDLEDRIVDRLRSNRNLDQEVGRTTAGPHRSDFLIWHGPKQTEARLCSTGEQKALLIGLLLAQLDLLRDLVPATAQILLLDEIAAHLDQFRRAALFERLQAPGLQVWMTGTDRESFAPIKSQSQMVFLSDSGEISTA